MADLPADFWGGWIAVITIASLIALAWLVWSVYFSTNGAADVADDVWDETLREGTTPAPLWWFWLILALLAFSVVYLILYPGLGSYRGVLGWSQGGRIAESTARYEQRFGAAREAVAQTSATALRQDPAALRSGASVFQNNCAACHGSEARGQADLFPDLTDADWQWGGADETLQQTIALGRQAVMPPWQAVLGDDGVSQVTDYVLTLSAGSAAAGSTDESGKLYGMYCSACHGADGAGVVALGAPALNDDAWLYGGSRDAVQASIAVGRNGVMPAFGDRLDDAQIKLLIAWLGAGRSQ
jgi:cytochrome c oxidase cbb3-type subunit III